MLVGNDSMIGGRGLRGVRVEMPVNLCLGGVIDVRVMNVLLGQQLRHHQTERKQRGDCTSPGTREHSRSMAA